MNDAHRYMHSYFRKIDGLVNLYPNLCITELHVFQFSPLWYLVNASTCMCTCMYNFEMMKILFVDNCSQEGYLAVVSIRCSNPP